MITPAVDNPSVVPWERINLDGLGLLIVDMQNDFAHTSGYFAKHSEEMQRLLECDPRLVADSVPAVGELLQAFRQAGLFVAHTKMIRERDEANSVRTLHSILPMTYSVVRGPDHSDEPPLVPESWGSEILDVLSPQPAEPVIVKRTSSAFYATDLELLLRRYKIHTLVLAGTLSHACLLHTAFDAWARDFDVIVVREATSTWASELAKPVMDLIDLIVGRVVSSREILSVLEARGYAI